jgi:mycothiol synthase
VAALVEIRRCRNEADELRSIEIYNAVWPHDAVGVAEVRSYKQQVRAWSDQLAWLGGAAVGSASAAIREERPDLAVLLLTVLAGARRVGAGSALYRAASQWVGEQGIDRLETIIEEDDPESLAFAERRGFVENERNGRLVLELAGFEPPPIDPPEGVEIVSWAERPELARDLYEVHAQAVPDVPGQEYDDVPSYEHWLQHSMGGAGDRPEATFVAVADARAVGYAKFSLNSAQPTVAFHDLTGVRRDWRGRGIAGALKRAQIAWAKEQGYERLQTENETRNEPIRRLNERLGYRLEPGRIFLVGPLAGEPVERPAHSSPT